MNPAYRHLRLSAVLFACLTCTPLIAGEWITAKEGAKLWNPYPQPNETCSWTGKRDSNGYATGAGMTVWYQGSMIHEVSTGSHVGGHEDGVFYTINRKGEVTVSYFENGRKIPISTRLELDDNAKPTPESENAKWITSKEGVRIWDPHPQPSLSCSWTGNKDPKGYADGSGMVVWYQDSKIFQAESATFVSGKYDGVYAAARPNGDKWIGFAQGGADLAVKLKLERAEQITRAQSPDRRSEKSSSGELTTGEKVGLAAIAAAGLWLALKNNNDANSGNSSSPQASSNAAAFAEGDYVTNRGFFQKWIGRITSVNGRTYTVRVTWADSSSPFYKGKSVDFLDDEFKALGNVCTKAAFQGYK